MKRVTAAREDILVLVDELGRPRTFPPEGMTTRFLIDPTQTDEEIVEFIMSVLEEDGAFEESPLNDHPPAGSVAIPDVKLGDDR